jgi:integrative and conjugative element protein (TIGR02256 family)
MGYWLPPMGREADPREAVVMAAIGPGPAAVHRPHSFSPDHDYQEREIARVYGESGRLWDYLGDWHSHPNGPGALSSRDKATLSRIALEPRARAPRPVMLILAAGKPWIPHAWMGLVERPRLWSWPRLRTIALEVRLTANAR